MHARSARIPGESIAQRDSSGSRVNGARTKAGRKEREVGSNLAEQISSIENATVPLTIRFVIVAVFIRYNVVKDGRQTGNWKI